MRNRSLLLFVITALTFSGTVHGEGNRSGAASPPLLPVYEPVHGAAGSSITNGTRLTVSESYFLGNWYFDRKSTARYVNGDQVRFGTEIGQGIIVDSKYNGKHQITESMQHNDGIPYWKTMYQYSPEGKPTGNVQLMWNGAVFDSVNRTTHTTDDSGFILQSVTQIRTGNQWNNGTRATYTRDSAGNQLKRLNESWGGSAWNLSNFDTSIYANGRVDTIFNKRFTGGTWVNNTRRIYAYDVNGDFSQIVTERWQGSTWGLFTRDTYTTLADNYMVLIFPNALYTFTREDSIVITWMSSGISTLKIELSPDNGSSWTTIDGNVADTGAGFYTYKNKTVHSSQCRIRISDAGSGSLTDQSTETFTLDTTISQLTHKTGTVTMTVFNTGHIGAYNGLTDNGAGFNYKGSNSPLFAAGPMIGTASTGLYGAMASLGINNDFMSSAALNGLFSDANFDQISDATFTIPTAPAPLNQLLFQQTLYSKAGTDYIYSVYTVKNNAVSTASGVHIGMTADWDIGSSGTNLGGVVAAKHLVYQYNQNGAIDSNYYGLVSLNKFAGGKVTGDVFDQGTRTTGWPWVTMIDSAAIVATTDYRSYIGSGPYDIAAGATVQAGFALIGAASLAELEMKADTVIAAWNSGILTDVRQPEQSVPQQYDLAQNYPNPFNPSTVIGYALAKRTHVTITVYDMLGKRVATIVNGEQNAGTHSVAFTATHLSSGVYFYRLQTNEFTSTKKFVLMR